MSDERSIIDREGCSRRFSSFLSSRVDAHSPRRNEKVRVATEQRSRRQTDRADEQQVHHVTLSHVRDVRGRSSRTHDARNGALGRRRARGGDTGASEFVGRRKRERHDERQNLTPRAARILIPIGVPRSWRGDVQTSDKVGRGGTRRVTTGRCTAFVFSSKFEILFHARLGLCAHRVWLRRRDARTTTVARLSLARSSLRCPTHPSEADDGPRGCDDDDDDDDDDDAMT